MHAARFSGGGPLTLPKVGFIRKTREIPFSIRGLASWKHDFVANKQNLSFRELSLPRFVSEFLVLEKLHESEDSDVVLLRARANLDFGWGRLFGGQPLGQALSASSATVPFGMRAHSLSVLFVREGSLETAPFYEVSKIRDGRSFCTRRVRAFQDHGTVLEAQISYHVDEAGLEHQFVGAGDAFHGSGKYHQVCTVSSGTNDFSHPDQIPSTRETFERIAQSKGKPLDKVIPRILQDIFCDETQPMIIKPEDPQDVFDVPGPQAPRNRNFIRVNANGTGTMQGHQGVQAELAEAKTLLNSLQAPLSEEQLSQVMLAFTTDFSFFATAFLPHGTTVWRNELQPASLSHTMYFHQAFTLRDWLMFDMGSPISGGARGFVRGEIFDVNSGKLVASAFQEGLMRPRKKIPGSHKKKSLWS